MIFPGVCEKTMIWRINSTKSVLLTGHLRWSVLLGIQNLALAKGMKFTAFYEHIFSANIAWQARYFYLFTFLF